MSTKHRALDRLRSDLRSAMKGEQAIATTTRSELRGRRRGASYGDNDSTSEYWGFLVWFCRFGTEALYWGFFLLIFDKHSIGFGLFCF